MGPSGPCADRRVPTQGLHNRKVYQATGRAPTRARDTRPRRAGPADPSTHPTPGLPFPSEHPTLLPLSFRQRSLGATNPRCCRSRAGERWLGQVAAGQRRRNYSDFRRRSSLSPPRIQIPASSASAPTCLVSCSCHPRLLHRLRRTTTEEVLQLSSAAPSAIQLTSSSFFLHPLFL